MKTGTLKRSGGEPFSAHQTMAQPAPPSHAKSNDHMLVGLIVSQVMATALLCMVALLTMDILQNWMNIYLLAGIGVPLISLLLAGGYVLGVKFGKARPVTRSVSAQSIVELKTELAQVRSQLRIAERSAHNAGQAKKAFVSQLNHNIRTPLNHILGFTELIRHETFGSIGDPRYVSYLDDIARSGEVLMSSFGQILELADFNSGNHKLNIAQVQLGDVEDHIRQEHSTSASKSGVAMQFGFEEFPDFFADKHCVLRVLSQLTANAISFTERGGQVSIYAYCADDLMMFCISDTGIGIAPKQLEMLQAPLAFSDFEQNARATDKGMGLALARTLTELCGGELRIDSTLGIGTTAVASFPVRPLLHNKAQIDVPGSEPSSATGGHLAA